MLQGRGMEARREGVISNAGSRPEQGWPYCGGGVGDNTVSLRSWEGASSPQVSAELCRNE